MREILKKCLSVVVMGFIGISCGKEAEEEYSVVPELTYRGLSQYSVDLRTDTGELYIAYDFVDGDGDIGTSVDQTEMRVTVINLADGAEYKFPFPHVPSSARSGVKYLKGAAKVYFKIPVFFAQNPLDTILVLQDTFRYSVQITDDKGNESNVILTDSIPIQR